MCRRVPRPEGRDWAIFPHVDGLERGAPLAVWGGGFRVRKNCLRRKSGLAGTPSGVDRAAKLRKIPPGKFSRTPQVVALTCGRQAACRGTHCFGRAAVELEQ